MSKIKKGKKVDKDSELIKNLRSLTTNKYDTFTKVINDKCIESAGKGNVHLVLTEKELNEMDFPISEYNFKTLRIFLQEEGLVVVTDIKEKLVEVFWVDSVVNGKTTKLEDANKFPAISDKEVRKLLLNEDEDEDNSVPKATAPKATAPKATVPKVVAFTKFEPYRRNSDDDLWNCYETSLGSKKTSKFESGFESDLESDPGINSPVLGTCPVVCSDADTCSDPELGSDDNVFDITISSDHVKNISSMTEFIKSMIDKSDNTENPRQQERIIYTMYLTILKVENDDPTKNDFIFKNKTFIDGLIDKLVDMTLNAKMNWPTQMIAEFEEIKRNRTFE